MRHRARRDLADPPLELLGEGLGVGAARRHGGRSHGVDDELDVGPRLAGALAEDYLIAERALAPVDVARIVALAHVA